VDLLWDYDLENRPLWKKSLEAFWKDDLLVGFDPNDGLCYFIVGFDPVKNETYLTDPGVIPELENPLNIAHLTWGGRHKTAMSTQLAYCAAVIADRLGDQKAVKTFQTVLEKVGLESCRELSGVDPQDLPPGESYRAALLNVYALCAWLWAYWLGRQKNLSLQTTNK